MKVCSKIVPHQLCIEVFGFWISSNTYDRMVTKAGQGRATPHSHMVFTCQFCNFLIKYAPERVGVTASFTAFDLSTLPNFEVE